MLHNLLDTILATILVLSLAAYGNCLHIQHLHAANRFSKPVKINENQHQGILQNFHKTRKIPPHFLSAQQETDNDVRRSVLKKVASGLISYFIAPVANDDIRFSNLAMAAQPMKDSSEADNVGARFERAVRPKPSKLLRPQLNKDFAVLLMRSSYNALDQLDCVAMDQFQRDFFFIRQAEYQPYVNSFGAGLVQQGELTDPNYFDFISFAQYATISRDLSGNPPLVFEEQQPVEVGEGEPQKFENVLIKRNPEIKNADLPSFHARLVGEAILDKLNNIFDGTPSAIPAITPKSKPSSENLLSTIKQLANLFLINGFAWEGSASIIKMGTNIENASGTEFQVKFVAPATWWSGQCLQKQKTCTSNDFFLKTVRVLLDRAGYSVSQSSVKYTKTEELTTFTVI